MAAPIIKWPGGKRFLLDTIRTHVPSAFGTYFEPFAGGAAIFFGLQPNHALLADTNEDLINFYVQLRDNSLQIIECLKQLPNTKEDYYRIRSWVPTSPLERASRFYYLTLLSFNGIYRVNLRDDFNVPYGRKGHIEVADAEKLETAARILQGTELLVGDFEATTLNAKPEDVIYMTVH